MIGKLDGSSARIGRGAAAALTGVAALATVAACSSGSSSPSQSASPTSSGPGSSAPASAPQGAIPGPPAGASQVSTQPSGGGTYTRYKAGESLAAVVSYYSSAFKSAGYTITESGGGGGGWGQYGGSDGGLEANNGTTFAAVNAGGSKQGPTYFEVCTGTSESQVDNCQSEHHSGSGGS